MKLIAQSVLLEGITHIEDLPLDEFIHAVETLKDKHVTEKLDGSNLWFGIDEKGFFTSREGKSRRGTRFYKVTDYPMVASYNGFRGAHVALERHKDTIGRYLNPGDMVEMEVLFGRQPNTVTYGNDEKNFIVILRGIETDQKKVDSLSKALQGKHSKVASTVITSDDGDALKQEDVTQHWEFTQVRPVDVKKADTTAAHTKLVELKNYLKQPNKKVPGKTNKDVAEISLNKVPKEQRDAVKAEREAQLAYILATFKNPIKEILLDTLVRKVKPFLQSKDLDPSEDIGVEGVVASDKKGNMIKIVDKDVFTAINTFNNQIRSNIAGLVRTNDQDAPIELRGGAFGQAKIRIGELLGMKELALSSSSRKLLMKFKGADAAETARNLADSMKVVSFGSTREKVSAILRNSLEEIDGILESFKQNAGSYKLKIEKTGKEIGISPEVMKRTLTAFAETKRDINEVNKAVLKSRELPELIMALYGRTIQGLFSGDSEVKESFKLIKTFEDGEGGEPPAEVTSASAIAPVEKKLMGGRMVTRRQRKYVKKKKFAVAKTFESKSLLKMVEFDMTQQFAKDVDDSVSAQSDVEFKALRNNIKVSGDQVTQQEVSNYLDKAHELNDEVDTVTFGMEMDDGTVVKVYVNQTQADAFEKALADMLGEEDDIEEVIDQLANSFDIVDVEWPDGAQQTDDAPIAVADPNAELDQATDLPAGEDGKIDSMADAEGTQQVEPIINLSSDEVGSDETGETDDEENDSLIKQVANDAEAADGEEEQSQDSPDIGLLDDGTGEQPQDAAPADGEEEQDPAPSNDGEEEVPPAGDEVPADADADASATSTDLGDIEAPADEESDEEDEDDTDPTNPEGGGGKKKKKKKKPEEGDDAVAPTVTDTKESNMSFGQRFKEKLLAEKADVKAKADKKAADKKKEDEADAAEAAHAFPDQLKKLMTEFPNRGSKMMLGLMHTLGTPLDAMIMKKSELKGSVESAGDHYMKDSQMRMWTKRVIDSIMEAKTPATQEGLEQELTNTHQKMILGILQKIGMVESIEKMARSALRAGVKRVAAIAQADNKVRTNLKVLAEMLGVDGVTGAVKEGKNHMGEPEQTTYAGWKASCKKVDASVWIEGDKDIAQAMVGAKPYKQRETVQIGEWDGEKGSVYKDAADRIAKLKKVDEAAGDPPGASLQAYVDLVKKVAMSLGVPAHAFDYKAAQTDLALKQAATRVKNRSMIQRRLDQMAAYLGEDADAEGALVAEDGPARQREISKRTFEKLKELGVKKVTLNDVRSFLEGGGVMQTGFIDELVDKLGYDDGATSYKENQKFWKKIGMSKFDYQVCVNTSV